MREKFWTKVRGRKLDVLSGKVETACNKCILRQHYDPIYTTVD